MASSTYRAVRQAILAERQITCTYNGHYRELCPHILGHTDSEEKLLAFQFGGESAGHCRATASGGVSWSPTCATSKSVRAPGMRAARIARSKAAWQTSISTSTSTSAACGDLLPEASRPQRHQPPARTLGARLLRVCGLAIFLRALCHDFTCAALPRSAHAMLWLPHQGPGGGGEAALAPRLRGPFALARGLRRPSRRRHRIPLWRT